MPACIKILQQQQNNTKYAAIIIRIQKMTTTSERIQIKSENPCRLDPPRIQRWDDQQLDSIPVQIDRQVWDEFCDNVDAVFVPTVKYTFILLLISLPSVILIVITFSIGGGFVWWIVIIVVIVIESAIQHLLSKRIQKHVEGRLKSHCEETSNRLEQGLSVTMGKTSRGCGEIEYYIDLTISDDAMTIATTTVGGGTVNGTAATDADVDVDVDVMEGQHQQTTTAAAAAAATSSSQQ